MTERYPFVFMPGLIHLDPSALDIAERYKILIGAIVPRPIALVSTQAPGPGGVFNVAPFSFFNGVSANPMTLLFCPANKADGSEKDTLRNCKPTDPAAPGCDDGGLGEFVVNVVSEAIERQMAACAEELSYGESEFRLTGLTPAPSSRVRPPRVAESPLSFECVTEQVIRLNPGAPSGGNIVIGRVVAIAGVPGIFNTRHHVDADRLGAIGRMGGQAYCRTHAESRFEMPMGRRALALPDRGTGELYVKYSG